MKMQKSTMILSGVLGVVSVGGILMYANPGVQEALTSNIFGSQSQPAYVMPAPTTNTTSSTMGKYEITISAASVTNETAYSSCKQSASSNTQDSIRCVWNGAEFFSRPAVPSILPKPTSTGSTSSGYVIPKPVTITGSTTPIEANVIIKIDGKIISTIYETHTLSQSGAIDFCANIDKAFSTTNKISCVWNGTKEMSKGYGTKVVTSTGSTTTSKPTVPVSTSSIEANLIIKVDGKVTPTIYETYTLSKSRAIDLCANIIKALPPTSKVSCIWNKTEELSKGYETMVVTSTGSTTTSKPTAPVSTGSTSTGTIVIPKTPVSTGSTASGVITPAKPVDILASITVTVDGKNQPDIYNTYKLNEMEAMSYCANLASKVPTITKFSCIWNGKELGKGFGTKVSPQTNSGSTNTGSATGSEIGVLKLLIDGYNYPTTSALYTGTKDGALVSCKGMLSNIGITNQVECLWNDISIFKGFGTMSRLEVYINSKRSTLLDNITKQAATEYCETTKTTTPTNQTILCRWNDTTVYSGPGKQVTPTSSGSTSTGSATSTGAIPLGTLTINTDFSIDKSARYNIAEMEAKAVCESTWKKYENDPKSTQLTCMWNGKTIFSKTKPILPIAPVSTGSTIIPNLTTPVSTGTLTMVSDYWGTQTQANISEAGAKDICDSTWKKYETNSQYTSLVCTWNGKTIFSKTKPILPIAPVSTGSLK